MSRVSSYVFLFYFLILKKLSTCQVIIVSLVNVNAMCQFVVVLLFLFNLVIIFVIFIHFRSNFG